MIPLARHFRVPKDRASYYGLDPGHAQYLESQGGGYPVLFEFEHHLHCVNLLRQSLHWNYDYYTARGEGPFVNTPDIVKTHVNHCVDILRQVIMCQPDTGVFGQYWVEETGEPFVDFRTNHKCKNFEDLRDWVMKNQISKEFAKTARVVPGDVILDHIP